MSRETGWEDVTAELLPLQDSTRKDGFAAHKKTLGKGFSFVVKQWEFWHKVVWFEASVLDSHAPTHAALHYLTLPDKGQTSEQLALAVWKQYKLSLNRKEARTRLDIRTLNDRVKKAEALLERTHSELRRVAAYNRGVATALECVEEDVDE